MAYGQYGQLPQAKQPNDPNAGMPDDQQTALQQLQQAYMTPTPAAPQVQDQTTLPGRGLGVVGSGDQGLGGGTSGSVHWDQQPTLMTGTGAQGGYTPGQGAGMFLGDFLGKQAAMPSLTDSTLSPIVAAGRLADQRAFDRNRAALAEQLGASGLGSSGAMNVGVGKLRQQQGEGQAMRESGLLQDETNARRAALLQGLGLDASRYQFDQNAGLQLAQLEALLNQNAGSQILSGY